MALTQGDLQAITELLNPIHVKLDKMDARLDKVESRLDKVDARLDKVESRLGKMDVRLDVIEMKQDLTSKKLNDLDLDIKVSERNVRRDIHKLNDEMETVAEVLKQNELIPL